MDGQSKIRRYFFAAAELLRIKLSATKNKTKKQKIPGNKMSKTGLNRNAKNFGH